MGLQEILDEIRKEAETEHDDIVTQARMESDRIVVKKLDELTVAYDKKYEALDSEMGRLAAKLRARAELEAERREQRAEASLLDGLIQESYSELAQTLRSDPAQYTAYLTRLTEKALGQAPGNGEAGLSFRQEDEKYFQDISVKISRKLRLLPPSKISGGVICVSGDIYLDYSLDNLYRKARPELVRILSGYFKE